MSRFLVVIAGLALVAAGQAKADDVRRCDLPSGVEEVAFSGAPAALQADFNKRFAPFVQPDQPFDKTGDTRRLITVRHNGGRWAVAFEQGGRGYSNQIVFYDVTADGAATHKGTVGIGPANLCATVNRGVNP